MGLEAFIAGLIAEYGLVGLLIASIIANASILFPIPIDILVLALGAVALDPAHILVIGLIAGFGASIGEMTGYILGLAGIKGYEKLKKKEIKAIRELKKKIKNKGMIVIFLGAFTPFPFDLIGIAAGLIKYDLKKFFASVLAGKLLRYVLIAFAGFYGIELIKAVFLLA